MLIKVNYARIWDRFKARSSSSACSGASRWSAQCITLRRIPNEPTQRKVLIQRFPMDADPATDKLPFLQLRIGCFLLSLEIRNA